MIKYIFSNFLFRLFRKSPYSELESRLNYFFRDLRNLKLALSHRSYVHNHNMDEVMESNERLEFLGDAVLDLIITDYLYRNYPNDREGMLSKMKSLIVSARVLAICARNWDLGKFIHLSHAEKKSGGRDRTSILADAYEAILGSVFLDGGIEPATALVHSSLVPIIDDVVADEDLVNYKSTLLEHTQSMGMGAPAYRVLEEWGPEHHKKFRVGVYVQEKEWGRGEGYSKKAAEQAAGRMALEKYVDRHHRF